MKQRKTKAVPGMEVEAKQLRLYANAEATERWMRKLLRAAHELEKLRAARKRMLGPRKPTSIKYRSLDDIRIQMAAGGDDFNDDIPI